METLTRIVEHLDEFLQIAAFKDDSQNGLQVNGKREVRRIAGMVDASFEGFAAARDAHADMIICHHGLYWSAPLTLTGPHYARAKILLDHNISVYAAHLPLDAHPEVGNNIQLLELIGAELTSWFAEYHGKPIGCVGRFSRAHSLSAISELLDEALQTQTRVYDFGPDEIRTVGIVSGGGCDAIPACHEQGVDLFVSGEPRLSAYHQLQEYELNAAFAGHYATETVGLRALLKRLPTWFDVETIFIDVPCDL
jgi:dinuclear metal center YbgI/SA1388 family protein